MPDAVLDASALLACLEGEPGSDRVLAVLASGSAVMSAVNLAEVLSKLSDRGVPEDEQRRIRANLDLEVRAFDEDFAWTSAGLRPVTRVQGLSTGDRACLALALNVGLPALTADRAWAQVSVGVEVHLIR